MSFGMSLKDSNGFEYYNSTGDESDGEFILILDVLTISSTESGSKNYPDLLGGNQVNLEWLILPDEYNVKAPSMSLSGTTISWVPGVSGIPGNSTVLVSIK